MSQKNKREFFKEGNKSDTDLRTTLNDPFFETGDAPYKECSNPNDAEDKSLCISIRDGSAFDGAIIRYTSFKLIEQELTGDDIACQYEYDIEVPPNDLDYEITDEDGNEFEKHLGEWLIDIIQKQMDQHAAADRDTNIKEPDTQ